MKRPHIVQYQGSKRLLASQIRAYMPHKFKRLVEPFAGMAAVSIAVAQEHMAESFLINDINAPLIDVLREAVNNPDRLLEEYDKVWSAQFSYSDGSVAHFYNVRERFNGGDTSAANMLYLLARCVKGSVRYGRNGNFNQSPDKRRHGTSPKTLAANLKAISGCLNGIADFSSVDYSEVLATVRKGDIVYMDPPYQGVSNVRDNRYCSGVDFDELVASIDRLNSCGVDCLISYDGKCGSRKYGRDLPVELGLKKVMLNAGVSSQSVLLGKKETTFESLNVSPGLQKACEYIERKIQTPVLERAIV